MNDVIGLFSNAQGQFGEFSSGAIVGGNGGNGGDAISTKREIKTMIETPEDKTMTTESVRISEPKMTRGSEVPAPFNAEFTTAETLRALSEKEKVHKKVVA
jgi:NAD(P)H-hydrate repair Nnr-like enzyme with NAD(P)H-hydrate epimerase domain